MIIYGYKTKDHGVSEVENGSIPESTSKNKVFIHIFQKFATLFFILPVFPLPKQAEVVIQTGSEENPEFLKPKKKEYSEELKAKIKEIKGEKKTPFFLWIGTVIGILFIFFAIISSSVDNTTRTPEILREKVSTIEVGDIMIVNGVDADLIDNNPFPWIILKVESAEDGLITVIPGDFTYETVTVAKNDARKPSTTFYDVPATINEAEVLSWMEWKA